MDQDKLRKLAGMPAVLTEAARPSKYEGTGDWDADFDEVERLLAAALRIVKSSAWNEWMTATDTNYDVNVKRISDALVGELEQANGTLAVLMNEMEKAT